jgi:hypothetical protein
MVDLSSLKSKLKGLTVEATASLSKTVGDGKKSSYVIFSVAGETVALGETGLIPTEKAFHNKADFERLYVPASLKDQQPALEELYIRMFPLTASQSKKEVLPPDDADEFELLRESLHYRLELLRAEILEDTTDGVEIREKLHRFDRLSKLIESLEKNFRKKHTQDYVAVVASSTAPPTKEPKIPLSPDDVDELLRRFGLILLQSQHQLPGFKFPVSPNQIVREVQSSQIDDEEGFLEEVKKEGEIPRSIDDVLDPSQKEKHLLESLSTTLETLIGNLGEQVSGKAITKLDIVTSGKTFEQGLTDLLTSLFNLLEEYEGTNDEASKVIDNMLHEIADLEKERDDCKQKLLKLTTGVENEGDNEAKESDENESEEIESIRLQKKELEAQLENFLGQIQSLKQMILDKQTANVQREEAVRKLGIVGSELEALKVESGKKDKVIAGLKEKEAQLESLQAQVTALEEKDRLSKDEKRVLQQKTADLDRVSAEKLELEEKLRDYDESLNELQALVSGIPLPEANAEKTPFEQLKSRILTLIPVKVVDEGEEEEADSPAPKKNILSLPILTLPSILSVKASRNSYFCDFLNNLSKLVSKYFDSEQGQVLQEKLTTALDEYNFESSSIPASTAELIQKALLYSAGVIQEPTNELTLGDFEDLSEITILKSIAPQAETVFLEGQSEEVATQIQSFTKVLDQKNLPPYPVLFLLYLLALRDWVNCVEINSKPVECPQIPPRLQRTVKCN